MCVSVCLLLCLCLSLLDSRPEADLPLGPLHQPLLTGWWAFTPEAEKRILLHRARILELVPRDSLLEKSQARWGFTRRPRTDFTSHPGTRTHRALSKLSEHRGSPHKIRKAREWHSGAPGSPVITPTWGCQQACARGSRLGHQRWCWGEAQGKSLWLLAVPAPKLGHVSPEPPGAFEKQTHCAQVQIYQLHQSLFFKMLWFSCTAQFK